MQKRACLILILLAWAGSAFAQSASVVKEVIVRGNVRINQTAILAAMRTQAGKPFVQADLRTDEENVLNLGFFRDVKILSRAVSDTETEVIVEVSEYPLVKEIRVVGNSVIATEDILAIVAQYQSVENVWNNRNARPINEGITRLYQEKGYFVQLEQIGPTRESPETLTISIIEPTVNEIRLVGLNRTKERTVRRIMKTRPGSIFSIDGWRRDIEELYYTYWFDEIKPEQSPAEKPGQFNLTLTFKEARTAQINAGVALDPQSRIVGTLSFNDTNFLGNGQGVGIQLSQATVGGGPSAEFAYNNRFYDARDTALSFQIYSKVVYNFSGNGLFGQSGSTTDDEFNERRTGASLSFTRPIDEKFRATLGLAARNSKTINLRSTGVQNYIQQDGDLLQLQMGLEYNTSRPTGEPYVGQRASIIFEPGYSNITKIGGNVAGFNYLLGRSNFMRTTIEYKQYWSRQLPADAPFDTPRPVLAFRARYGHVTGKVPFFEQLFVGGSDSLRGYSNQRFWGNNSVLATLEYRYPIQKSFNLVGFVDYGGAWGGYGELNDFKQTARPRLKLGYGLGVAFRTPLGPIRIDFAFNQEGGSRTHFLFGTSF